MFVFEKRVKSVSAKHTLTRGVIETPRPKATSHNEESANHAAPPKGFLELLVVVRIVLLIVIAILIYY